jgi:hypothetical protein
MYGALVVLEVAPLAELAAALVALARPVAVVHALVDLHNFFPFSSFLSHIHTHRDLLITQKH